MNGKRASRKRGASLAAVTRNDGSKEAASSASLLASARGARYSHIYIATFPEKFPMPYIGAFPGVRAARALENGCFATKRIVSSTFTICLCGPVSSSSPD